MERMASQEWLAVFCHFMDKKVNISYIEEYSFDVIRGVAYTYFPDIEKLLEQL